MQSSNPVLTRLTPERQTGYAPADPYGQRTDYYPSPVFAGASDRLTIDDVVVKTVTLIALTAISAVAAVQIIPATQARTAWIAAGLIGLVLGLIISFKQITNPPLLLTYAVVEGVFVGMISSFYEELFDGIVVQAAGATFGIFLIMTALYKFRVIRATPKFTRGVIAAGAGVIGIILINVVLALFGVETGLRNGSPLAIGFSLVIIVIGALFFILDFDLIEKSIAAGAPKKMAWTCAFGLLVSLIWVYLEVLRLLSYLRGRD